MLKALRTAGFAALALIAAALAATPGLATQATIGTINPSTTSGTALATLLNNAWGAMLSLNSGTSRPIYAIAGTLWRDTSTTPWVIKLFDGSDDITVGTVDPSANTFTVSVPNATTSAAGLVELATAAETQAGSDATRAVTPAALATVTASTSAPGLVELATNAETQTGTDAARAVTPAALASVTASSSAAGLVELATNAETQTGTDSARAVTPAGLASVTFANSQLASMATGKVKARGTGSTGAPEDIAVGAGLTLDATSLRADKATINTQTASYTAVAGDAGKTIEMNVGSANNFTVPPNASVVLPVGTFLNVVQYGAGATTIVAGSGVTIRARQGLKLGGQYAMATLYKRATDEWVLGGDVKP